MVQRRILIVDDELEIVDMLKEVLADRGYTVDKAADASQALELIRQNIYDAAILDFNLPDMNGVMLHRQIRQIDQELGQKTLFTSGLVQTDDNLTYYAAHGQGFLSKPFDIQQVLEALGRLWNEQDQPD